MRSEEEINDLGGDALYLVSKGESTHPDKSFEDGILATLDWLKGYIDIKPTKKEACE